MLFSKMVVPARLIQPARVIETAEYTLGRIKIGTLGFSVFGLST